MEMSRILGLLVIGCAIRMVSCISYIDATTAVSCDIIVAGGSTAALAAATNAAKEVRDV